MKKIYDLAVKTGEYVKDGETKGRYVNVGAVMEGENGKFIFINRTFNPAGVPNPDNRDNILVSMFSVKDKVDNMPAKQEPVDTSNQGYKGDDDIPF